MLDADKLDEILQRSRERDDWVDGLTRAVADLRDRIDRSEERAERTEATVQVVANMLAVAKFGRNAIITLASVGAGITAILSYMEGKWHLVWQILRKP